MSRKASVAAAAWADPLGAPRRGAVSAEVACGRRPERRLEPGIDHDPCAPERAAAGRVAEVPVGAGDIALP